MSPEPCTCALTAHSTWFTGAHGHRRQHARPGKVTHSSVTLESLLRSTAVDLGRRKGTRRDALGTHQVLQVAVGTTLDQLLHYLQVALLSGDHQRRLPTLRSRGDSGAQPDNAPHPKPMQESQLQKGGWPLLSSSLPVPHGTPSPHQDISGNILAMYQPWPERAGFQSLMTGGCAAAASLWASETHAARSGQAW